MSLTNSELLGRAHIQDLVNHVAAVAGAEPARFGRDGSAAFAWNNGQGTLVFEESGNGAEIIAHLDLCAMPGREAEEFFQHLLGWNWTGRELQGAFFALDTLNHRVLICHWFPAHLETGEFAEQMRHFLSLSHAVREKLFDLAKPAPSPNEPMKRDFRILDHV
jgi:hypothetical protein